MAEFLLAKAMDKIGDRFDQVRALERRRCIKIVREALDDHDEYIRSVGEQIVNRILEK